MHLFFFKLFLLFLKSGLLFFSLLRGCGRRPCNRSVFLVVRTIAFRYHGTLFWI